jgi:hypothetical protein
MLDDSAPQEWWSDAEASRILKELAGFQAAESREERGCRTSEQRWAEWS